MLNPFGMAHNGGDDEPLICSFVSSRQRTHGRMSPWTGLTQILLSGGELALR